MVSPPAGEPQGNRGSAGCDGGCFAGLGSGNPVYGPDRACSAGKIAFETRERGLDVKQIHVYEDKEKRRMVTALVASKWGGGIPVKNYRKALERASGMAVRLKEDTRSILTQEPVMITAYEDTCFYALSGVASEKKRDRVSVEITFLCFRWKMGIIMYVSPMVWEADRLHSGRAIWW